MSVKTAAALVWWLGALSCASVGPRSSNVSPADESNGAFSPRHAELFLSRLGGDCLEAARWSDVTRGLDIPNEEMRVQVLMINGMHEHVDRSLFESPMAKTLLQQGLHRLQLGSTEQEVDIRVIVRLFSDKGSRNGRLEQTFLAQLHVVSQVDERLRCVSTAQLTVPLARPRHIDSKASQRWRVNGAWLPEYAKELVDHWSRDCLVEDLARLSDEAVVGSAPRIRVRVSNRTNQKLRQWGIQAEIEKRLLQLPSLLVGDPKVAGGQPQREPDVSITAYIDDVGSTGFEGKLEVRPTGRDSPVCVSKMGMGPGSRAD